MSTGPIDHLDGPATGWHCRECRDSGRTENGKRCQCEPARIVTAWHRAKQWLQTTRKRTP